MFLKEFKMKKRMSFYDHVLIGYYLKVAHIASLKASTVLANKDGKSKAAFQSLKKLNTELFNIRCDLESKLYSEYLPECAETQLRQRYLGALDRKLKLIFKRKNIFF